MKLMNRTRTRRKPEKSSKEASQTGKADQIHQWVETRAYELFLLRGGVHGHHEDDWFSAEKEIAGELHEAKK